jgi:hypothetical protein
MVNRKKGEDVVAALLKMVNLRRACGHVIECIRHFPGLQVGRKPIRGRDSMATSRNHQPHFDFPPIAGSCFGDGDL